MDSDYAEFLKGKRVVVIGGNDATIDKEMLMGADVVVRINGHWMRQGGRCDAVYYSCSSDVSLEQFKNKEFISRVKWVWANSTHVLFSSSAGNFYEVMRLMSNVMNVKVGTYFHGPAEAFEVFEHLRNLTPAEKWAKELSAKHKFHPFTGLLAVHHLLLHNPREVWLTGMSFYRHSDGEFPAHAGAHEVRSNIRYVAWLKDNEPRVYLDKTLSGIVDYIKVEEV